MVSPSWTAFLLPLLVPSLHCLVHPIKSLAFVLGYAIDRGDEATLFLNLVVSFQDFHQVGFFSNLQGLAMSFLPFRGDTDRNGNLFFFLLLVS